MADATMADIQSLQGILTGLGLNALPGLLQNLYKAQNAGRNLREGRSHKDDGPTTQDQAGAQDPYAVQSMLAPLLQQLSGQGGPPGQGQQQVPVNAPGVRPGMPPPPLPRMAGLPRTMQAGAGPSGF